MKKSVNISNIKIVFKEKSVPFLLAAGVLYRRGKKKFLHQRCYRVYM